MSAPYEVAISVSVSDTRTLELWFEALSIPLDITHRTWAIQCAFAKGVAKMQQDLDDWRRNVQQEIPNA